MRRPGIGRNMTHRLLRGALLMETSLPNRREIELSARDGARVFSESSESEGEARVHSLARLGAAIALGAHSSTLQRLGRCSIAAGASTSDVIATLLAVAPIVGEARLVSATQGIALSIGYDVDEALENPA